MAEERGFSVFALDHTQHARTIKKRLQELRAIQVEYLASGNASDWPDYKRRIGRLEGLDEALHICNEVEREDR